MFSRVIYRRLRERWGKEGTPMVFTVSGDIPVDSGLMGRGALTSAEQAFETLVQSNHLFAQITIAYGLHRDMVPPLP